MLLKISTAQTVTIGPVLDSDGAAVTSAVVTNFSLSKNGSSAALTTETLTHLGNGYYTLALTATNTNTLGNIEIYANNVAMSMTVFRYNVIAAQVYDSIVSGADLLQTDVREMLADVITSNTLAASASSEIATSVRTELSTELARIDVATSTRLASASYTTPPTVGAIADQVWDEAYADHTLAGSFGKLLNTIRKANLAVEGVVSNAITPTTLTFSSNVSATTSAYAHAVLLFVSGPLTGENSPIISYNSTNGVFVLEEPLTTAPSVNDEFVVIAGSHVHAIADIQSGLATSSGVTAGFSEIKGATWSASTDTLEKIRDTAGASVSVLPFAATTPDKIEGDEVTVAVGDVSSVSITIYDKNKVAVDLTAFGNLEVCIEKRDNTDLQTIANANLTISGAGNNVVTFSPNSTAVSIVDKHRWSLRTETTKKVIAFGPWIVQRVALKDA